MAITRHMGNVFLSRHQAEELRDLVLQKIDLIAMGQDATTDPDKMIALNDVLTAAIEQTVLDTEPKGWNLTPFMG